MDLLYVHFAVPDLAKQSQFLNDFGLQVTQHAQTVYARGTDPSPFIYQADQGEPAFLGLGFEAESKQALEQIAAIDNTSIAENPALGGGLIASLIDPDGNQVDVLWGMDSPKPLPIPSRSLINCGAIRQRIGERVSFVSPPQSVKRLGHCVLQVSDFRRSEAWYKKRFGLLTSDEIYAGDPSNVIGAFLRCNRGEKFVDHHTLFLVGAKKPGFNHAAFEIADWDSLMLGHYNLQQAGYTHSWGVGKHKLGSQVFDYWKDPNGFTLEHFTDGDLFNADFGSHTASIDQLLGTHWGPPGGP